MNGHGCLTISPAIVGGQHVIVSHDALQCRPMRVSVTFVRQTSAGITYPLKSFKSIPQRNLYFMFLFLVLGTENSEK